MQDERAFHKIISGMKKRGKKVKSRGVKPLFSSGILFDSPKVNSLPKLESKVPEQVENRDNIKDELRGFKETIEKMVKNIITNTNTSSTNNTYNTNNSTTNNKVFNVGGRINKNYTNLNTSNVNNKHIKSNKINNTLNTNSLNQLKLFNKTNQSKTKNENSNFNFVNKGDTNRFVSMRTIKNGGTNNFNNVTTQTKNRNKNLNVNFVVNGDTNRSLSTNTVKTDGTKNFNNNVTKNEYVKSTQRNVGSTSKTSNSSNYFINTTNGDKKIDFIGNETKHIKNNHIRKNETSNIRNTSSSNQLNTTLKRINQSNFISKTSPSNFITKNNPSNYSITSNTVKTDGTTNFSNAVTQNKYVKPIQEKADGGWITGSLKGYPVSLDGKKIDFIGHGTEYVANKPASSFVIPVDTPETRKNPKLTEKRVNEAKRAGFKLPEIVKKNPTEIKKPKMEVKPLPVMSTSLPQKGLGGILSGIGSAMSGVVENSPFSGIKDSIGGLMQNPIVSGVKDSIGGFVEKSPLGKLNSMVSSGIEKATGVNPKETITNLLKSDSSESKLEKQVTENNMVKSESEKISETSKKEITPLAIPVGSNNTARSDSKGMGTIPTGGDNNFVRIAKEKTMFPNWRTMMG